MSPADRQSHTDMPIEAMAYRLMQTDILTDLLSDRQIDVLAKDTGTLTA